MPANPLVSVIIPSWNAAAFLPAAVASIREQRYEPIEIVVVDDGSTDGTESAVAALGPGVRYFRQDNRGPAAARNRGLAGARGEFIAFLDADDRWPRHKLSIQLARLLAEPQLDFVLGRIRYVPVEGGVMPDFAREAPGNAITHVHLGSGLFRRGAFERVGEFDHLGKGRLGAGEKYFFQQQEFSLRKPRKVHQRQSSHHDPRIDRRQS